MVFSESPSGSQQTCGLRFPEGKHPRWHAKCLSRRGASSTQLGTLHTKPSEPYSEKSQHSRKKRNCHGPPFHHREFNHNDWDSETKDGIKTHDRHCRSIAMASSWSKSNKPLLHKHWYKPSLFLCPTTSTKQIGLVRGMLYKISSAMKAIALKAGTTWCLHQLYQILLLMAPSPLNAFLKARFSFPVKFCLQSYCTQQVLFQASLQLSVLGHILSLYCIRELKKIQSMTSVT